MNKINIFYEHILEGCAQSGVTEEQALTRAKAAGIDGLECDLWRLADRNAVKARFDRCGLSVSSVYNRYDFPNDDRETSLRKIAEHLETAAFYGADKVLAIPGFVNDGDDRAAVCEKMCGLLSVMCEKAAEYGITVTLEDYDDSPAPYSTIAGLEYFMQNVPALRFTFDTGNFAYSLEDAAQAYSRLKPYVVHAHLKDRSYDLSRADVSRSNGKADLSGRVMYPAEVGGGFIGIEKLVRTMLADGYSGSFSIEHFGAVKQLEYIEKSAQNVRAYLSEVDK